MKILLVSNGFPPSGQWGTEFYTYQLAIGLKARGHEVSVFCPKRLDRAPRYTLERSKRYGIKLVEIYNGGDPRKSFADSYQNERVEIAFAELLDETKPDAVHFIHMLWGLSVRMPTLASERGIRTVASLTDYGLLCHRGQRLTASIEPCASGAAHECARCIREPGPWDGSTATRSAKSLLGSGLAWAAEIGLDLGWVVVPQDIEKRQRAVRRAMQDVDEWVAPTRAITGPFLAEGLDPQRLTVLPYALDPEPYRRQPSSTEPGHVRLGFLGQFLPHKGLHVLFEAVRILQARPSLIDRRWDLKVYGNPVGGRNGRYMQSIGVDELTTRVLIEGPFEPLRAPEVLAGLDVAILPSLWDENAPLTILQAQAAGVPIIASDVPGVREIVEPGPAAQLFPPGDALALADAMEAIIREHPGRDVDRVQASMDLDSHLDRMEGLYGMGPVGLDPEVSESGYVIPRGRAGLMPTPAAGDAIQTPVTSGTACAIGSKDG